MARVMEDTLLAAWLEGGQGVAVDLPFQPPPTIPPTAAIELPAPDDAPVEFPQVQEAVRNLEAKQILTRDEFDLLLDEFKQSAFTVANVQTEDALEKLRNALAEDIATGGTLAQFREKVDGVLGKSALNPWHIENVYRTNVGLQYKAGQQAVLNHPLVTDEFPYVMYSATHDRRTRPEHLELETSGIQGTNIYRRDDPVIQKFWAPWDYQCRCVMTALTLEDAAAKGIREAQEWLKTGVAPRSPAYVSHPPFEPPPGFGRARLSQIPPRGRVRLARNG